MIGNSQTMVVRQVQIGDDEHHQMAGVQMQEDVHIQHHPAGTKLERIDPDEQGHDPYAFDDGMLQSKPDYTAFN